jgi:hypothetical protein
MVISPYGQEEAGMSAAYQHLALSQVKPGMILSDELLDQQGQILLPKGAVLTEKIIGLLPGHGIEMLAVLRPPGQAAPDTLPHPGAAAQRLAKLFRKNEGADGDACATGILQRYITEFRLQDRGQP